jgi:hypothetical protein
MRRILWVGLAIFLITGVAAAQEFPKFEIFGGYSLLNVDSYLLNRSFDMLQKTWGAPSANSTSSNKLLNAGFDASFTYNYKSYVGIEGAFQYNTGVIFGASFWNPAPSYLNPGVYYEGQDTVKDFAVLGGPRFAYRKSEKVTPFAHVLFGVDRFKGSYYFGGTTTESTTSGFAYMVGGGIDVKVVKKVAIRLFQIDLVRAKHKLPVSGMTPDDFPLKNLHLSFGAIYRFGGK